MGPTGPTVVSAAGQGCYSVADVTKLTATIWRKDHRMRRVAHLLFVLTIVLTACGPAAGSGGSAPTAAPAQSDTQATRPAAGAAP